MSNKRIGCENFGKFYTEGKVRNRREWRGVKDTLYDYSRWLHIMTILAKFIVKPRNIKAMFRYRWMANYLAVPMMSTATRRACAMNICVSATWSRTSSLRMWQSCSTASSAATAASATIRSSPTRSCSWMKTR